MADERLSQVHRVLQLAHGARGLPLAHGAAMIPGLAGLHFVGFTNPITGNLREMRLDARRMARAVAFRPAGRPQTIAACCPAGTPA